MAVKLIYQMFAQLLSWMVLHARSDTANEIEILILRHQLAVLQRRTPRARVSGTHTVHPAGTPALEQHTTPHPSHARSRIS